MRVKDVMSTKLISVSPDATIAEAIALMVKEHISGLPVVGADGHLAGVVSEGDFLRRIETGTQPHRRRWLEWLFDPGSQAEEYARSRGRKVSEVMTAEPVTIEENADLAEAADLMEQRHVKRLPVLRGEQVVGIVTRSDLMRALVGFVTPAYEDTITTDEEIRKAVLAELKSQSWAPVAVVTVDVDDGVVTLRGSILDERQRDALKVAAENVSGVKEVKDKLVWVEPYTGATIPPV